MDDDVSRIMLPMIEWSLSRNNGSDMAQIWWKLEAGIWIGVREFSLGREM